MASNQSSASEPPAKRQKSDDSPFESWVRSMFGNTDYSDLILVVGPEKKKFHVHRFVLCAKSPFFKAACKKTFKEGREGIMNLPDAPVAAFEIVLDSLYDGQFRLSPTFDDDLTLEVWKLTDYFDFKQLAKKILDEMERWCLEYKESREKEFSTSLPQQYAYGPGRPMENLILHVSALASPTLYPQLKRILQVFLFSTRRQDVDLSTGMTGLSTKRSVMKSTQTYCGRISVGRVSLSSK